MQCLCGIPVISFRYATCTLNNSLSLISWACIFCAGELRVGHIFGVSTDTGVDVHVILHRTVSSECDSRVVQLWGFQDDTVGDCCS